MEALPTSEGGSGGVAAPQEEEAVPGKTRAEDISVPPSLQQLLKVIAEHKVRAPPRWFRAERLCLVRMVVVTAASGLAAMQLHQSMVGHLAS